MKLIKLALHQIDLLEHGVAIFDRGTVSPEMFARHHLINQGTVDCTGDWQFQETRSAREKIEKKKKSIYHLCPVPAFLSPPAGIRVDYYARVSICGDGGGGIYECRE